MHHNGLIVDDVPHHLAPDPQKGTHSIHVLQADLTLPLHLKIFNDSQHMSKTDRLIAPIKMIPPEACDLKLNHRIPTPTVRIDALSSRSRGHSEALRNKIAMTFGIRLETAERTLHATTQLALCQTINPLHQ
jgi:hypothetical protein